jgi:uncharacterized membrane protein
MKAFGSTRWLVWGFGLSIGINVFLIGFIAARSFGGNPREAVPFAGGGPHRFADPELRAALRKHSSGLRAQRQGVNQARQLVQSALKREPFRPEELASALDALRAQTAESQAAMHRELIGIASELTPEQRQRLAESRWVRGSRH